MYLKSLTLRGSSPSRPSTTLQLEPGITCIVGPNGSGKSNVVDALAWVMGEQGAKSLRGGKMEDVIFAGTAGRPPLGRAEVVLTIDNSDGALPIEYAEVTISRTMFRSGGSEYAINGQSCRLLDVQELLSDSGIGREMHVIVGQGQLDTILHATPEDRRGFIEEAAGVLKHRKRKEKALRKLDATDGNLTRLGDLLGEIRRQLKPLGRQAEVARRAAGVQADVRDARARLLADDLVTARTALEQELADETILRRAARGGRGGAGSGPPAGDRARGGAARGPARAGPRPGDLVRAVRAARAPARHRSRWPPSGCATPRAPTSARSTPGRDPERLEAEAAEVREQEQAIAGEVATQRAALETAVTARRTAEEAAADEERRVAGLLRAAADRREGLARLHGQVNALRTRAAAADDEIGRLRVAREEAVARADRAQRDFTALETKVAGLDAGEEGLDAEHESAVALLDDIDGAAGEVPRRGPARRPRAIGAGRPQGGPRAGPGPARRRRRAAGRHRPGLRPARLGGRAAVGAVRLRDRGRRRPRLGGRRGRRGRRRRRRRRHRPPQDPRPGPGRAGARRRSHRRDDRRRLARAARPRGVRRRQRGLPRRPAPGAGAAALQGRRRRRPRRRAHAGRRPARRHRRDPGRRPDRAAPGSRRLELAAEPAGDPGRRRRGHRLRSRRPSP